MDEIDPAIEKSTSGRLVRIAGWCYGFLGVIWFVFGIVSIIDVLKGENTLSNFGWIIAILMFANALVFVLIGWRIEYGKRWLYYFGLIVLVTNIFLTLTDEFGVFDFIYLILAVSLFVFLIATRAQYTSIS
jgi:hypothetical protein